MNATERRPKAVAIEMADNYRTERIVGFIVTALVWFAIAMMML